MSRSLGRTLTPENEKIIINPNTTTNQGPMQRPSSGNAKTRSSQQIPIATNAATTSTSTPIGATSGVTNTTASSNHGNSSGGSGSNAAYGKSSIGAGVANIYIGNTMLAPQQQGSNPYSSGGIAGATTNGGTTGGAASSSSSGTTHVRPSSAGHTRPAVNAYQATPITFTKVDSSGSSQQYAATSNAGSNVALGLGPTVVQGPAVAQAMGTHLLNSNGQPIPGYARPKSAGSTRRNQMGTSSSSPVVGAAPNYVGANSGSSNTATAAQILQQQQQRVDYQPASASSSANNVNRMYYAMNTATSTGAAGQSSGNGYSVGSSGGTIRYAGLSGSTPIAGNHNEITSAAQVSNEDQSAGAGYNQRITPRELQQHQMKQQQHQQHQNSSSQQGTGSIRGPSPPSSTAAANVPTTIPQGNDNVVGGAVPNTVIIDNTAVRTGAPVRPHSAAARIRSQVANATQKHNAAPEATREGAEDPLGLDGDRIRERELLDKEDDDEMDGKQIVDSRSHPEVSTTASQSVDLGLAGQQASVDARGGSLDSFQTEELVDIGLSTVPNQFCTIRDAADLKKLLLLSNLSRGGMVPSSTAVMDMYMVGKVVGVGSYGKVRAAWHRLTGSKVAIKTYDKSKLKDPAHWKRVNSEIKIMEQVSHPRIARMFEAVETPKRMHLIMECLEGGDLCSYVKQKRRLSEEESRSIFFQVLQAIDHLHALGVAHRDVKLENVLFVDTKDVKLIDFGFSTVCQDGKKLKVFCGTPSYMAPEIVRRTEYDGKPVDIWSLGIFLYALLCGCFPFRAKSYPDLYRRIARGTFQIPEELSPNVKDMLTQLLEVDADKRITAHMALRHPWLQLSVATAPDINRLRLETKILISDRASDDVDEETLVELSKFGIPREDLLRLIMAKVHSSMTTVYYLLLEIVDRRRKVLNKQRQQSQSHHSSTRPARAHSAGAARSHNSNAVSAAMQQQLQQQQQQHQQQQNHQQQHQHAQQHAAAQQFQYSGMDPNAGKVEYSSRPRSANAGRSSGTTQRPLSAYAGRKS